MAHRLETNRYRSFCLVLGVLTLTYLASGVWSIFRTPVLGVMFCPGYEICRIYPDSPAQSAGFQLGDKIQTVDGEPISELGPLGRGSARPGDVRRYEIDRAGERIEVAVRLRAPSARNIYLRTGPSLIGLTFILVGLYVFLKRPTHTSWVFYAFSVAASWILSSPPGIAGSTGRFFAHFFEITAWFACATLLAYLFLIFPRPKRLILGHPKRVSFLFIVPAFAAMILVLELALSLLMSVTIPHYVLIFLNTMAGTFIIGYFLLAAVSFLHGYFTSHSSRAKRSMRLILAGAFVGIAPVAVYSVLFAVDPHLSLPLEEHVVLFATFIPLSLGYGILHQETEPGAN